ncbi:MAG: rRNA maturation RNase YbeY [Patescibacteria group bacterium]
MKHKSIVITNSTKQKIPERYFLFMFSQFLEFYAVQNKNIFVSLIIVGEKKIQSLNKEHRGINKPTDVLSFPIDITSTTLFKEVQKSSKEILLGDIYLCPRFIDKNINSYPIPLKSKTRAYQYLFLHSLLHLVGLDHHTDKEHASWEKIITTIWPF